MNEEQQETMTESPADQQALEQENAVLRRQIDELRRTAHESAARDELITALTAAGARSPQLLAAASRPEFQLDAAGRLINREALTEHLRQSFPEQFDHHSRAASIDAGTGRASAAPLTRDALSRMKPAEIARLDWNDVRRVLER